MKLQRKLFAFAITLSLICSCAIGQTANVPKLKRIDDTTTQTIQIANQMPSQAQYPLQLVHTNGEGNWGDTITLQQDGSFKGEYLHINKFETGEQYPNGTQRYRKYSGRFTSIRQLNATTYTMKLVSLTQEHNNDEPRYENGYRHLSQDVVWMNMGDTLYFYLPQTRMANVPQDLIYAWEVLFGYHDANTPLGCYSIYNVNTTTSYFVYP